METGFRGGLMDMRLNKSCVSFSDMLLTTNGALTPVTRCQLENCVPSFTFG